MSIKDLDLILKKDPIISTWPARSLADTPQAVEKDYFVHAKTHISLGDTAAHVDSIFKWVSGQNKGAFIGAVLGDYGEGKTSFLVHVWASSSERKVCTVPPFEWNAFEQIAEGIASWLQYILRDSHAELARRVERLHDSFRQQTLEELSRKYAKKQKKDYDTVLDTLRGLIESGSIRLTEMSAARLLDFMAGATNVVREAGYKGLLVLLDEPEVAAKQLGTDTVQLFLFDLANELHRRQGNYGVFVSMPKNFHASAQSRFAALTARLEVCGCFPRLTDIYGSEFARTLWDRYVAEFSLGQEGRDLVAPLALRAIGQLGASERKDLSYGPRSVVSAFSRMVDRYQQIDEPYEPQDLVRDVLDQEIMVQPDYRSKIQIVLHSQDVNDANRDAVTLLAAFPSGLSSDILRELGYEDVLRPLARAGGLIYHTAFTMGLRALRSSGEGGAQDDPLRDAIEEIDSEYAPDRRTFENAFEAFCEDVVPRVFVERKGQQLIGWQMLEPLIKVGTGTRMGTMIGAFEQMARSYPRRAAIVLINSLGAPLQDAKGPGKLDVESGPQSYELLFQFDLRWRADQEVPGQMAEIHEGRDGSRPARILLHMDLVKGLVIQEHLAELVGADRLTPLWVFNLLHRMRRVTLPRQFEGEWAALRSLLLRPLVGLLMGESVCSALSLVAENKLEEKIGGSDLSVLDRVCVALLRRRYPDYETLIRQPHWQGRVDSYINALSSGEVPLACKRGREPWKAQGKQASRVLGVSRMNLTGGAFTGFESLIEVKSKGHQAPLEIIFRIHPLEEEIRNVIMAQGTGPEVMLKREGKDCPYLPIKELLPVLQEKGYTVEELGKLIQIGEARKSFEQTMHRHERVLFCRPLDPDELKAQLRAKLNDLVEEIKLFKGFPDYVSRFDPAIMQEAIERVADDADHDRLRTRMNKEFEQNHSRLPGYFDRVQETFSGIRNRVNRVYDILSGSRDATQLEAPSATSPWGSAMGRYIVPNLLEQVSSLRKTAKALREHLDRQMNKFAYSSQHKPDESIARLGEAWSGAHDDEAKAGELCDRARELFVHLNEFGKWRDLLRQSDQVYERLMVLKQDSAHQVKADEFIGEFDRISEEIENHIELRNVMGLPAYSQFAERLEELEKARQDYIASVKGTFDRCKDKVNQLMETLNVGDRVRVTFNPMDVADCYEQLYVAGAKLILERIIDRTADEISTQERELSYARDVLRVVSADDAAPLLDDLHTAQENVSCLRGRVDAAWLRAIVATEKKGATDQVAQGTKAAFAASRAARQKVRDVTKPVSPRKGLAKTMYDMVPESGEADFKDLVLKMMVQTCDPAQALDVSLETLIELFRRNCIQIRVERRGR